MPNLRLGEFRHAFPLRGAALKRRAALSESPPPEAERAVCWAAPRWFPYSGGARCLSGHKPLADPVAPLCPGLNLARIIERTLGAHVVPRVSVPRARAGA